MSEQSSKYSVKNKRPLSVFLFFLVLLTIFAAIGMYENETEGEGPNNASSNHFIRTTSDEVFYPEKSLTKKPFFENDCILVLPESISVPSNENNQAFNTEAREGGGSLDMNNYLDYIREILPPGANLRESFTGKLAQWVLITDISWSDCQAIAQASGMKHFRNFIYSINLDESVQRIGADRVWRLRDNQDRPIMGYGVKIAVLDTGVDRLHPDFPRLTEMCFVDTRLGGCPNGRSEMTGPTAAYDRHGHGTHVASIAAGSGSASNGVLKGVAPGASIIAVKVLNDEGSGTTVDILKALERLLSPGLRPDVINLSLGLSHKVLRNCYEDLVAIAVDRVVNFNITVVAAAGNEGPDFMSIGSPGCARNAITVGASDKRDRVLNFSSVGPALGTSYKPDVVAPGHNICAAQTSAKVFSGDCGGGRYVRMSGTSMAAPHVTGIVALIRQKNPHLSPGVIKHILRNNAVRAVGEFLAKGYGRVNALASVLSGSYGVVTLEPRQVLRGVARLRVANPARGLYYFEYGGDSYFQVLDPLSVGNFICSVDTRDGRLDKSCPWNTTNIPDGVYTLRVIFHPIGGLPSQDSTLVLVRNNHTAPLGCHNCLSCSLLASWPNTNIVLSENMTPFTNTCVKVLGEGVRINCNRRRIVDYDGAFSIGFFVNARNCSIENCNFERVYMPIHFHSPGERCEFRRNTIFDPVLGITLDHVRDAVLTENHITTDNQLGRYVIGFPVRGNLAYSNHQISTSNTINGKPFAYLFNRHSGSLRRIEWGGIHLRGCSNIRIEGTRVADGDGILIYKSSSIKVLNNRIERNYSGIAIPDSQNTVVMGNSLINNRAWGIRLELADGSNIIGNNILSDASSNIRTARGIIALASRYLQIRENIVRGMTQAGMLLYEASGRLRTNTIEANTRGVQFGLKPGYSLTFEFNSILRNQVGLDLFEYLGETEFYLKNNAIYSNSRVNFHGPLYSGFHLELSHARRGNFWGRTTPPFFCEAGNSDPRCGGIADSSSPGVRDSCPYGQAYPAGQWPISPVCR